SIGDRLDRARTLFRQLSDRVANYAAIGTMLARAGATFGSIAMLPVRRRLNGSEARIELRNGISIAAPADEPLVQLFKEIWVELCYAPVDFALPSVDAIVDIGANVGVFTLWAAITCPRAMVVALEPSPMMFQFLHRNICESRLYNVTALEAACA